MKKIAYSLATLFIFAMSTGCRPPNTGPQRVDVQQDTVAEGIGVGSADVIEMADKLVRRLMTIPEIRDADPSNPPTVVFLTVKNMSDNSTFNTELLRERVMDEVVNRAQGKMRMLARDNMEDVQAEREAKRAGVVTSSGKADVFGADYFVQGKLMAATSRSMDERGQYTVIKFTLIDAETTAILGSVIHEFKKVQSTYGENIYQ